MLNKTMLLIVVGMGLSGCERVPFQVLSDSGSVVRVTVEPDDKCGSKYRIFSVGSKFSLNEVCAGSMSLAIGEPKVEITKELRFNPSGEHAFCESRSSELTKWLTPKRCLELRLDHLCYLDLTFVLIVPRHSEVSGERRFFVLS